MIVVERLTLCSKFAKNRLSAGLRPDTLGSLQGRENEERGRTRKGREGEGGVPPSNKNPGYGPAAKYQIISLQRSQESAKVSRRHKQVYTAR